MGGVAAPQPFTPPAETRLGHVGLLVDDLAAFERVVAATGAKLDAPQFDRNSGEHRPPVACYREAGVYVSIRIAEAWEHVAVGSSGERSA